MCLGGSSSACIMATAATATRREERARCRRLSLFADCHNKSRTTSRVARRRPRTSTTPTRELRARERDTKVVKEVKSWRMERRCRSKAQQLPVHSPFTSVALYSTGSIITAVQSRLRPARAMRCMLPPLLPLLALVSPPWPVSQCFKSVHAPALRQCARLAG